MQRCLGRPENLGDAQKRFDQIGARTYRDSEDLSALQTAMTAEAWRLLRMDADSTCSLVLDVGCGTGCSCSTLQALLGSSATVVGLDISRDMLLHASGLRICGSMTALPLARPVFDAVISVSALQWLVSAADLDSFFGCLEKCWAKNGTERAVLQWYPEDPDHARRAVQAAAAVGLGARLVVSYPSGNARKWYLCVWRLASVAAATAAKPVQCPLAWPFDAACKLCWNWRSGEGCCTSRAEDALLAKQHRSYASRLVRLARRVAAELPVELSAADRAMIDTGVASRLATIAASAGSTASEIDAVLLSESAATRVAMHRIESWAPTVPQRDGNASCSTVRRRGGGKRRRKRRRCDKGVQ